MRLGAAVANHAWLAASAPAHRDFARALRDPRVAQEALALRYIRRGRATRFGREHEFGSMRSYGDFAARVPARDYEALRPWIEATARGERAALTREPVRRLQPTGGSTGGCKWIPFTSALQAEFARAVGAWVSDLSREHPGIPHGRAYWSVTPSSETPAGPDVRVPAGFEEDSAYLGGILGPLVEATLAVPSAIRGVADMREFRRITLLHLLRAEDLSMISVWHPSFLALLMDTLRADWRGLLRDLARGLVTGIPALDVRPSPQRARALEFASPGVPRSLWPRLALVSCWGDAAAAGPMEQLQRRFAGVAFQPKGLLATEAIVSIPYRGMHPLAVTSHLFEFERPDGRVKPVWEVEEGCEYSVLVTTGGGLHRYRLRDRVLVTGFLERTPCIRFLGKEDRISDWYGEKLDEAFVATAVERALSECGVQAAFALLAAETGDSPARYVLFLEPLGPVRAGLSTILERELDRNPQYHHAVRLGQLGPAAVEIVDAGAAGRYLERLRGRGARLGDIKPAALSALDGWRSVLAPSARKAPPVAV